MSAPPVERAGTDDFPELMKMLVTCFRTNRPDHPEFCELFPDLYRPTEEDMGYNYIIRQDGRIASCVGLFPIPVLIGGRTVNISGIGGVSTLPEYRRRGFMGAIMDHVMTEMICRGYPFGWLGGDRRRYMTWGYELAINHLLFNLNPLAPGLRKFLGKLTGPVIECDADQADWDVVWRQAQTNPKIAVCGRERLKLKYNRLGPGGRQKLLYLDDPDGAHVVVSGEGTTRHVRAWAGQAELVGAIIAEKLNGEWEEAGVSLPWYPDHYCLVFKELMRGYSLVRSGNLAVMDLSGTLNLFKDHFDRRVEQFGLKGAVRLAMGPAGQIPAQEVLIEADGRELVISQARAGSAVKVELTCHQMVELMFTALVVGWSVRLDPAASWITTLFPVPFYLPEIFSV